MNIFLFTFFLCIPPRHRILLSLHPSNFTGKVSISSFYPYYSSISLLQLKLPSTAPIPCYSSSSLLQLQIPTRAPVPYYSSNPYYSSSSLLQLQLPTTAPDPYYSYSSLLQPPTIALVSQYSSSSILQLQIPSTTTSQSSSLWHLLNVILTPAKPTPPCGAQATTVEATAGDHHQHSQQETTTWLNWQQRTNLGQGI